MKINKISIQGQAITTDRDSAAKLEKQSSQFVSDLVKASDDQYQERLNKLIQKITDQGSRLSLTPTFSELKAYKDLVRSFLSETISRMYSLHSQAGWDRQGRQKVYSTVKQIDGKLAELTEDVRVGQERQLSIVDKVDTIRGMLIDLYT